MLYLLNKTGMNDLKQTRKTATPIHRGRKAMNKDLTSGNFAGDFGLAYPNALDWERINEWSSSIWREATGMQRDFWVTPGVSNALIFIKSIQGGKIYTYYRGCWTLL